MVPQRAHVHHHHVSVRPRFLHITKTYALQTHSILLREGVNLGVGAGGKSLIKRNIMGCYPGQQSLSVHCISAREMLVFNAGYPWYSNSR